MPPRVTAIVLNYRTPKLAVRCTEALLAQTCAEDLEIIVLDNHSQDESIGYLRNRFKRNPNVQVWEMRANVGYGKGNNYAITRSISPYLYITNPDNELEPDGIAQMLNAMERDATIGILGPKLLHEDGTVRDSARAFPGMLDVVAKRTLLRSALPKRMKRYLQADADPAAMRDSDWLVGACLMIRRDVLEKIGMFDPRFFLFFEDMDLCRRCWESATRVVYFPRVHATDRKRRLSEGGVISLLTKKTGRIHIKSAIQYFWKWRGQAQKAGIHTELTP